MKIFIIILTLFFTLVGYPIIELTGGYIYILYLFFIWLNCFQLLNINRVLYKRVILANFTFVSWTIYGGLNLFRQCWIGAKDYDGVLFLVFISHIAGTILLFIGFKLAIRQKTNKGFVFSNRSITPKTFLIVSVVYFSLQLFVIQASGGFMAYFFAAYGNKVESSLVTFASLFGGILSNVGFLAIPFFLSKSYNLYWRFFAFLVFLFYLILGGLVNGGSIHLLNGMLAVFCYLIFIVNDFRYLKKYRRKMLVLMGAAVVLGMLIRQNRKNVEKVKVISLEESISNIMKMSTFDGAEHLTWVYENVEPKYTMEQFIVPFVSPLPRKVFTWKPVDLSRIAAQKTEKVNLHYQFAVIVTPMGEFYYDFGVLGIILGMIFIGFVIGSIQRRINFSPSTNMNVFILISCCIYSEIIAGWYTGWGVRMVRFAVFIVFLLFIQKIFNPNLKKV